ncbi:hypothetical protein [Aquimarina sp. LLG6339-5]|uniref:hypothetical protein n=1 Tax=Aquimarina sp. LLG6339-5 TaxID=3160830 RepID=UPI00386D778F
MKLNHLIILIFSTSFCFGQTKNHCGWTGCNLSADNSAHFDPYYNGHLCENFDPKQSDFSQEYLELQTKRISEVATEVTEEISDYNFVLDSLFNTYNKQQNGIIGLDNRRIKIHISKTEVDKKNELTFLIYGKSNVKGNICDFKGKLKIIKVFEVKEGYDFNGQGELFAKYEFFEDKNQNHVGSFKGTFDCAIKINHTTKSIKLDESFAIADGYYNRTYVGTWKSYKSGKVKKCIWGDYRLPFTFDLDCGDGEMHICEKYEKNGWTSFNDGSEFRTLNRWWNKK